MTSSSERAAKRQKKERTPLILNFFEAFTPSLHAPGQWRNPRDQSRDYYKAEYWVKLAQLAERGKLHALFIGDSLAIYGGYKGPFNYEEAAISGNNFPKNDPTAYLSAIALQTKNISVGYTCSTLTEHPYHFARRLATLDHISGGRVAWNIVSSALPSAGRQLADNNVLPEKSLRYEKTDEYVQALIELLASSWRDDGVVFDREKGIFSNPDAIREINFEGKYFTIPGPQITEPSPQRVPLLIQAGASDKGLQLAAKVGELIFIPGLDTETAKAQIEKTKKLAQEKYKRNPDNLKFVTSLRVIVGKTHEEAIAKHEEIKKYHDFRGALVWLGGTGLNVAQWPEDEDLTQVDDPQVKALAERYVDLAKAQGKVVTQEFIGTNLFENQWGSFVGSAEEVADLIEDYVDASGVDGFNFSNVVFPETFTDIVDLLIPELQKRGLAQTDYAVDEGTLREQVYRQKGHTFFPEDHTAYPLRWRAGESKEVFEKRLKDYQPQRDEWKITADAVPQTDHISHLYKLKP